MSIPSKLNNKRPAVLLGLSLFSGLLFSESTFAISPVRDTVNIQFRQARYDYNPSVSDNATALEGFFSRFAEDSIRISKVNVEGYASPEGSESYNRTLSERRAKTLLDIFARRSGFHSSEATHAFGGRNWKGLLQQVETDTKVPDRSEVLDLLKEIVESLDSGKADTDLNLIRLKRIGGGEAYGYMYENLFPALRISRLTVEYSPMFGLIPVPVHEYSIPLNPIIAEPSSIMDLGSPGKSHPLYWDIRTNLLYDALLLPNVGLDFYVGKNLSVGANWMYGWWDRDSSHRYWRAYGGDLNLKWWFGRKAHAKPLTGHHLGIFAGLVTYDFEFGHTGYMGGHPGRNLWHRCNFISGIEYGYSLPVASRLNIDFSIALGYLGGKVVKYKPRGNGYEWLSTRQLNWFGPTKAEISLVWLLGPKNVNPKKGGAK